MTTQLQVITAIITTAIRAEEAKSYTEVISVNQCADNEVELK